MLEKLTLDFTEWQLGDADGLLVSNHGRNLLVYSSHIGSTVCEAIKASGRPSSECCPLPAIDPSADVWKGLDFERRET